MLPPRPSRNGRVGGDMKRIAALASISVMAFALPAAAQSSAGQSEAACAALTALTIPGLDLKITKAEWFAAGAPVPPPAPNAPAPDFKLPAFCRLDGVLDARRGADGASYGIGFALSLPADWNGRFLQQGGGGLNGSVRSPLGGQAAGATPALARGFAVVTTDTGHTGTN